MSNDGEVGVISKGLDLLVDHKSEDAHHGGTAVVELDGALGELGLLVEGVPAEVDGAIAEVADGVVVGSAIVTLMGEFEASPQALKSAVIELVRDIRTALNASNA